MWGVRLRNERYFFKSQFENQEITKQTRWKFLRHLNNALEAVVRRCFVKPSFRPATLLKSSLAQVFPMNFAKFLRKLFFTENFRWPLLMLLTSWVKFTDPFFMSKKQRYVGLNFLYDTWVPMDKINEYNRAVWTRRNVASVLTCTVMYSCTAMYFIKCSKYVVKFILIFIEGTVALSLTFLDIP